MRGVKDGKRSGENETRDKVMHKILFEATKKAIARLFSDLSVSRSVTLESFKELLDFIEIRIEALEKEVG